MTAKAPSSHVRSIGRFPVFSSYSLIPRVTSCVEWASVQQDHFSRSRLLQSQRCFLEVVTAVDYAEESLERARAHCCAQRISIIADASNQPTWRSNQPTWLEHLKGARLVVGEDGADSVNQDATWTHVP